MTATLLGSLIASSPVMLGPDSLALESKAELQFFSLMPGQLKHIRSVKKLCLAVRLFL